MNDQYSFIEYSSTNLDSMAIFTNDRKLAGSSPEVSHYFISLNLVAGKWINKQK